MSQLNHIRTQEYHIGDRVPSTDLTPLLWLDGPAVERLLDLGESIDAVERAFRAAAAGRPPGGVLGVHVPGGGFHVKAAVSADGAYFAAKLNANFSANPQQHALPTIQGLVLLSDARTGTPLAMLDSASLTRVRTAAATGVAVRHLALPGTRTVAIVGCGAQAPAQLEAVSRARPLAGACVYDLDPEAAVRLAAEMQPRLGVAVRAMESLEEACRGSDIIVTSTTARAPFLRLDHVRPGAMVAAVGADAEAKQELEPRLMAASAVVTDETTQCAGIGELHHALEAGAMRIPDVRAELGDVVAGLRPGRLAPDERIVFDSTGVPLEDVATAALAYQRALATGTATARLPRTGSGG